MRRVDEQILALTEPEVKAVRVNSSRGQSLMPAVNLPDDPISQYSPRRSKGVNLLIDPRSIFSDELTGILIKNWLGPLIAGRIAGDLLRSKRSIGKKR